MWLLFASFFQTMIVSQLGALCGRAFARYREPAGTACLLVGADRKMTVRPLDRVHLLCRFTWSKDTVIDWHFIVPEETDRNSFIDRVQ